MRDIATSLTWTRVLSWFRAILPLSSWSIVHDAPTNDWRYTLGRLVCELPQLFCRIRIVSPLIICASWSRTYMILWSFEGLYSHIWVHEFDPFLLELGYGATRTSLPADWHCFVSKLTDHPSIGTYFYNCHPYFTRFIPPDDKSNCSFKEPRERTVSS